MLKLVNYRGVVFSDTETYTCMAGDVILALHVMPWLLGSWQGGMTAVLCNGKIGFVVTSTFSYWTSSV